MNLDGPTAIKHFSHILMHAHHVGAGESKSILTMVENILDILHRGNAQKKRKSGENSAYWSICKHKHTPADVAEALANCSDAVRKALSTCGNMDVQPHQQFPGARVNPGP